MFDSLGFKRLDLRGLETGGLAAIPRPPGPPVSFGFLSRANLESWEQGCHCDQAGGVAPIDRSAYKTPAKKIDSVFVVTEQAGKEALNQFGCILHLLPAQAGPIDLTPETLPAVRWWSSGRMASTGQSPCRPVSYAANTEKNMTVPLWGPLLASEVPHHSLGCQPLPTNSQQAHTLLVPRERRER